MQAKSIVWAVAALLLSGLAAGPLAIAAPSEVAIAKRSPQAQNPDASANDNDNGTIGVQVNPNSGTARTVSLTVNVDDDNGHNDVSTVTVTVYKSDNTTVQVSASTATKTAGSAKRGTYVYNFNMNHFDDPGTYYVKAVVDDRDGEVHTAYANFTYQTLAAVSLSVSSVSLTPAGNTSAAVAPNADTHANPSLVNVTNSGNTQIDLQYSSTDLSNATLGTTIGVANIHYSTASNMSGETSFATTATTDSTFNLAKGSGSTKTTYLALHVPSGTRAGAYTGTITFAAVAG